MKLVIYKSKPSFFIVETFDSTYDFINTNWETISIKINNFALVDEEQLRKSSIEFWRYGSAYELRRRNVRELKKRLMRKGREEEDIERKKKNREFQI